jgi:hypothetical protein
MQHRGRDFARHPACNRGVISPGSMIDLTPQDIAEFQQIFHRETGQTITEDQAREYATNLLGLVSLVRKLEKRH